MHIPDCCILACQEWVLNSRGSLCLTACRNSDCFRSLLHIIFCVFILPAFLDTGRMNVSKSQGPFRMRVPPFSGLVNVAFPTLFPQCLSSRKTFARPLFSIAENLQVVSKHLRKCCQAVQFSINENVARAPEKKATNC